MTTELRVPPAAMTWAARSMTVAAFLACSVAGTVSSVTGEARPAAARVARTVAAGTPVSATTNM